jgi:hypothetical protein
MKSLKKNRQDEEDKKKKRGRPRINPIIIKDPNKLNELETDVFNEIKQKYKK